MILVPNWVDILFYNQLKNNYEHNPFTEGSVKGTGSE